MDASELAVAHWVYEHRQLAGLGTATLPGARALYLPLVGSRGAVGVLGMSPADAHALESPEQLHQLETFANQMALAIERAQASEDAQRAEVRAEAERLRNSLLSSVSHDLRTPLASITGAASSLLEAGDRAGRRDAKGAPLVHPPGGRAARPARQQPPRDDAPRGRRRRHPQGVAAARRRAGRRPQAAGRAAARSRGAHRPPRRSAARPDRRAADRAGPDQHPRECRQVHARRKRDRHLGGERRRRGAGRHRGPRPGLRAGRGGARVRQVLPGPGRRRAAASGSASRSPAPSSRPTEERSGPSRGRAAAPSSTSRCRSATPRPRRLPPMDEARRPPAATGEPDAAALSKKPVVVLIEDEPEIRRFLRASLTGHGYRLFEAATGDGRTPRGRVATARRRSSWTSACPTSTGSR